MSNYNWTRRDFIKGIGATTAGITLSSCAVSADKSAKGLTEEALAVEPIVRSQDLEKPDLIVDTFPLMIVRHLRSPGKKAYFASMV
jgi:hypothetical protein